MNLRKAAVYLFKWIDGQSTDDMPASEISAFFDRQPSRSPQANAEHREVLHALQEQPCIPEIIRQWRGSFAPQVALTDTLAIRFIQQVLGAFESVDFLMDYRSTGGYTEARQGQWNDYPTYRPGRKRGWGIHFTTEGAGSYNCLRRTLEVGAGDLILLTPEAFYDYRRLPAASSWGVHWVAFQAEKRLTDLLKWPEVGAGIHHLHCAESDQNTRFMRLFQDIAQLSHQPDPHVIRLRQNLLEEILLRCQPIIPAEAKGGVDRRVETAIGFIENHYTRDISVHEVAAVANVSVSSLARLFKQHTGLTVLGWRDERRMALACEKLTHSKLRISEIADLVGYQDQLYFSRAFRRYFGQPPSDYRKQFLST
jgi:AraC family transcriptional regulator of arabinose operon